MGSVLETALAYHAAGLGVLPVRPDGSKAPALGAGHPYLRRRPTEEDLRRWFASGRNGIGIACGRVSGNLETLDFETVDAYRAWRALVEARVPGLTGRLCWVRTPGHLEGPGLHGRYRCPGVVLPGPVALAFGPGLKPGCRGRLLVETRGEGSYAVAPGSPAACHPGGRPWEHAGGPDLLHLPMLTPGEREVLLACARALDCRPRPTPRAACRPAVTPWLSLAPSWRVRPGDDYNRCGPDWSDILTPHGWALARCSGGVRYWRRPGKAGGGWSATTGYCRSGQGHDLLYVFSANAQPLEGWAAYSKFRVYALLCHHGDYAAAARELAAQGFGASACTPRRGPSDPWASARAGPSTGVGERTRLGLGVWPACDGATRTARSGEVQGRGRGGVRCPGT
jgi:putative DNA primase/helicase